MGCGVVGRLRGRQCCSPLDVGISSEFEKRIVKIIANDTTVSVAVASFTRVP